MSNTYLHSCNLRRYTYFKEYVAHALQTHFKTWTLAHHATKSLSFVFCFLLRYFEQQELSILIQLQIQLPFIKHLVVENSISVRVLTIPFRRKTPWMKGGALSAFRLQLKGR